MPSVTSANMTDSEILENKKIREDKRITSRLGAFKITNGLRPAIFSTIVGQQGNGKSALCKTIAMDCMISNVGCYVLLSEEPSSAYKATIYEAMTKACNGKDASRFLELIKFDSMINWKPEHKKIDFLFSHLEEMINTHLPEVVIFDNFTTSFLGSLNINVQGEVIDKFRRMADLYDIIIIGVFHTVKGLDIYKKLMTAEDVRGNASSTNGSAYNYTLATYFNSKPPRAILTIDKARYHPKANKTYWELNYDMELELYTGDRAVNYEYVNTILDDSRPKKEVKKKYYGGF